MFTNENAIHVFFDSRNTFDMNIACFGFNCLGYSFILAILSPQVASFTKEVNSGLAKRPLVFNGRLANRGLTSLVKEATGVKFALHFMDDFSLKVIV